MTTTIANPCLDLLDEQPCACQLPPPPERRRIRKAARKSMSQVAKSLGVDIMTVSRWERGVHEPRARYIAAYRHLLDKLAGSAHQHVAGQAQK